MSSGFQSGSSKLDWARIFPACLGVVMGAGLLLLSVPRTIAAWEAMPSRPLLEKIDNAKSIPISDLRDGIRGLERSVSWVASDKYLKDLGTLEFSLYQALPLSDPERTAVLAAAERYLLDGLAANPADGLAWYRLAQVRQSRGGDTRPIVVALMQSVDMAPNFRPLFVGRTLGLILFRRDLTPEETLVAEGQIRTFLRVGSLADRKVLYGYLRGDNDSLAMIERALQDDPEAKANYEALKAEVTPPTK